MSLKGETIIDATDSFTGNKGSLTIAPTCDQIAHLPRVTLWIFGCRNDNVQIEVNAQELIDALNFAIEQG